MTELRVVARAKLVKNGSNFCRNFLSDMVGSVAGHLGPEDLEGRAVNQDVLDGLHGVTAGFREEADACLVP